MKSIIVATLLLCGLAASSAATAHPQQRSVEARQQRQESRIAAGVAQGQLTRCESARLDHRAGRIEHREHAYRASAGLQPWERRDLNRRLDGLSRDIREQRRDGAGCW